MRVPFPFVRMEEGENWRSVVIFRARGEQTSLVHRKIRTAGEEVCGYHSINVYYYFRCSEDSSNIVETFEWTRPHERTLVSYNTNKYG